MHIKRSSGYSKITSTNIL